MMKVARYDASGKRMGEFELDEAVFGGPVCEQAVHEAVLMQLSNARHAAPRVKGYTEVKGGSAKPWRQKHTGRARAGTRRSHLWRGGAKPLGPDGRANHEHRLPRKVRRLALKSIFRDAAKSGRLAVIQDVAYGEPKTKQAVALLEALEFGDKKVLFVIPQGVANFEKSVRNLPRVRALVCTSLNPHDLLNHERIMLFEGAYGKVVEVLK